MNGNADIHVAVLLAETLDGLGVRDGGVYVDATFGAGGHTRAILERGAERVIAFDLDADARERVGGDARIFLIHANFGGIAAALGELGIGRVDGVLFDFGVSSMQLDQPERGFSFQSDGPLDMRMDASGGMTAYDLLSSLEERELAEILHSYGEEPSARRIARAIIAARKRGELPERTGALARMIAGVVHRPGHRERTHPATRTFQALRIAVNDELHSIERGLAGAIDVTRVGGRVVAISFHSLEDRIVKQTFRSDPRMNVLTKKPIGPGADEISRNPRSRSAKLRVAERAA